MVESVDLLALTAQIVAAHVAANTVPANALPAMILSVHHALAGLGAPAAEDLVQEPAVPIKRSIQHEFLFCLEDGAKLKTMKRYLARFGLTPETYRVKWGLPRDYPMVAPAYTAKRSALAKQFGLGSTLRTLEQSAPEAPRLPVEVDAPTVPVEPEPEHTAASVFANFPDGGIPQRKPSGQQTRSGRKRSTAPAM